MKDRVATLRAARVAGAATRLEASFRARVRAERRARSERATIARKGGVR
jgi:hypothetical protein